mgnify:CR=1 FL=1
MKPAARRNIGRAAWLGGALLLGIWLWGATAWVPRLWAGAGAHPVRPSKSLAALVHLKEASLDRVETNPATRLERVVLQGWVLPPGAWRENGTEPTQCDVVLGSQDRWYRVATDAEERRDVRDVFGVHAPQVQVGFQTRFSPVGMKGGKYRLGLVVRAGTNDLGVAWTEQLFIQDRHGFRTTHE